LKIENDLIKLFEEANKVQINLHKYKKYATVCIDRTVESIMKYILIIMLVFSLPVMALESSVAQTKSSEVTTDAPKMCKGKTCYLKKTCIPEETSKLPIFN
jgi:hypothetical protein